jgi:hypothetical protein
MDKTGDQIMKTDVTFKGNNVVFKLLMDDTEWSQMKSDLNEVLRRHADTKNQTLGGTATVSSGSFRCRP